MPLQMRLPKRGFKNPNREAFTALNLDQLQAIAGGYKLVENPGAKVSIAVMGALVPEALEAVAHHGVLRPGARLIHKPFAPHDLALAAGELLGAAVSGVGVA